MITFRTSRASTAWTTPSAYIQKQQDFVIAETQFYIVGNHYLLHHVDYYIHRQNSIQMFYYIQSQIDFWTSVKNCLDVFEWKLMLYTRHLPLNKTLWAYPRVT